ncbi:YheC/YheD family protein [Fodinisporobacter ferrooxydans]|uniref:YheC/YheD family protein n=1 Tax=Fodinisporobacter ferrooxydans TaxID=2901836 RepID=A0ABY4CFQ5_9BACL|nr:YheC/YheD family protein [Alicyclobacillaceae bacterium MYW30-H2]
MPKAWLDPERGFLNKWEMYKALKDENIGPCKLPVTEPFNISALQHMLNRYPSIYVKPAGTWGGRGISRIDIKNDAFLWTLQTALQGNSLQMFESISDLYHALQLAYQDQFCIVQQAAPLVAYEGRPFDIRVHMQRETDENWAYSGSLVRVSGTSAIVSNVEISEGSVLPVEQAAAKVLQYKTPKIRRLKKSLEQTGFHICRLLDSYRIFNEIGIDLGIDPNGQLWLIEVNTDDAICGPSHDLFAKLEDKTMYNLIQQRYNNRQLQKTKWLFQLLFADPDANENKTP